MTTFKNNSKYAELIFLYLDVAVREDTPITVKDVLLAFEWNFKGGNLRLAAESTMLNPETSGTVFPSGSSARLAEDWPNSLDAHALKRILLNRKMANRLRARGVLARVATFKMLTSSYGVLKERPILSTGMKAIYYVFGQIWTWAGRPENAMSHPLLESYTRELSLAMSQASRQYIPQVEECRKDYTELLGRSRVGGLLAAIKEVKQLIKLAGSKQAQEMARTEGRREADRWLGSLPDSEEWYLEDRQSETRVLKKVAGGLLFRVGQQVAMLGVGKHRFALGQSDMERLHQLLMSTASCLVGVCSQAAVGTLKQKRLARAAVEVAERNIQRIVESSRKLPLGDEVLVCKGYRRAYTAHLGYLAGPLCKEETKVLEQEAEETAAPGVLDIQGFLLDARSLDAASSLNACKVFKICPAPDVSPGAAMIDRVLQVGNGNVVNPTLMRDFEEELTAQILRAYIKFKKGKLKPTTPGRLPYWWSDYISGNFAKVPSMELASNLLWEGDATMPDVSEFDPSNWKDSGLGADTIEESLRPGNLGDKGNMLTRLVFDGECPMPGNPRLSEDHVIKFFMKAEGHKDPARGIFSANLIDRQAQSWMERAVDQVAREHPSFMIGQPMDQRMTKVAQLTSRPISRDLMALYYSFDISGWSAKMPAEPQRISHSIWSRLYGGHLFERATQINEGAHIYLNLDGYQGWFKNTHANLEGFNGKEMTMVLVALLSLSVRRWRQKAVDLGLADKPTMDSISALLFAYIDDGLSRIDLPRAQVATLFPLYKETVIETFDMCGFTVEVSKCFPSDRFAIFLNEVYLAGRHVVHGVRAAMGISSEPTERHTSLVERVSSVCSGVRGAVIAGLDPLAGSFLLAYHVIMHLLEWVSERDPVVLSCWSVCPRAWGGLGLPNLMQLYASGSGSAFEESIATLQGYSRLNQLAKAAYVKLSRSMLEERDAVGILVAPLSGKVIEGYMVDSRVAVAVRKALLHHMENKRLSPYAERLLSYSDRSEFEIYANAIIPMDPREVLQEQMLTNLSEAHPHTVFADFARRLEKATTLRKIVGQRIFSEIIEDNRLEAMSSTSVFRALVMGK